MAHFARVTDNEVGEVIVIANSDCGDEEFPASEPIGLAFNADTLGISGTWLQTSYSGSFRGCYAGNGYTYDPTADVFVKPPYTPPEY